MFLSSMLLLTSKKNNSRISHTQRKKRHKTLLESRCKTSDSKEYRSAVFQQLQEALKRRLRFPAVKMFTRSSRDDY